jgi:hypothetical protein
MDGSTVGWLAWIAAFVVLEGRALITKRQGDTLSEHVWKWFAIKDKNAKAGQARRAVLLMGLAWLSAHFLTGGHF